MRRSLSPFQCMIRTIDRNATSNHARATFLKVKTVSKFIILSRKFQQSHLYSAGENAPRPNSTSDISDKTLQPDDRRRLHQIRGLATETSQAEVVVDLGRDSPDTSAICGKK